MVVSDRPARNGFVAAARKIYHPIGFSKGYNFILWFIFLGAFLGFILARLQFLDFYGVFCSAEDSATNHAGPGECFYWLQPPYTVGVILHLAGILPAGLLACIQFIPVVRHKARMVHRVNGYIVITLSLIGTVGAFMILRRAFGGGYDTQTGGGALGIAFIFALSMAYVNIKRLQIEQHRAWMLRAWVWAGCIITDRLILFIALSIPTSGSGPQYYAMPCDKIAWMLGGQNQTLSAYPECQAFFTGASPQQHAVVHATFADPQSSVEVAGAMDSLFGMALWLAFLIHIIGVELYLHLTPAEAERLRRYSYQRQLEAGMRHPGSAGLTADRLGDADKWTPPTSLKTDSETSLRPSQEVE
ncbi:hypothetical protein F4780DRAFT_743296 [Xylariomycetidae sp. FL0641]|nr:hypothetical protein F4780DRAFT_743296 [Xylariomycetidae sp. FL0641]